MVLDERGVGWGGARNVEATSAKTSIGMITQLALVYRESAYHSMEEAAGVSPSAGKFFVISILRTSKFPVSSNPCFVSVMRL